MFMTIRNVITLIAFSFAAPTFAGDTVLTVSGNIAKSSEGDSWAFDIKALMAFPSKDFVTTTIWTEGEQQFEGVPLTTLMHYVGAQGDEIRAVAMNDYAVLIPMADAVEDGPIIAYTRNGAKMSVRDKGPLWIIYPFDDNKAYKSEAYYSRSIWQLDRIEIISKK